MGIDFGFWILDFGVAIGRTVIGVPNFSITSIWEE
jgi:hypothetical protein